MNHTLFYQDFNHYRCLESVEKNSHEPYLCYCGKQECPPSHEFGPATRTEFLLHIVLDGKGTFSTPSHTYELEKNSIFLIYPNQTTYYQADADDPWTYIWIGFNGPKAETLLRYAGFTPEQQTAFLPDTAPYETAVHGILTSCQLNLSSELRRSQYLYAFVAQLADDLHQAHPGVPEFSYPGSTYVRYALDYIEHHYRQRIKVSDIANYVGISRAHLTNCFNKELKLSPREYLIDYRMNKAKDLLTTTALPINQIASSVGYEDPLSFSKAFKLVTGVSPKSYREN